MFLDFRLHLNNYRQLVSYLLGKSVYQKIIFSIFGVF